MKIVIAIDSFKGSLSSIEVGKACKAGIERVTDAEIILKPLADGSEGMANALVEGMDAKWMTVKVRGADRKIITASYAYLPEKKLAVIEMTSVIGLKLIPAEERHVEAATSYGVGQLIRDAIKRGCRDFVIGTGGSSTNDFGMGMLTALGVKFMDADGKTVGIGAEDTGRVDQISLEGMVPELSECRFRVACNVAFNPLIGEDGTTYIYGAQKGLHEDKFEEYDAYAMNFAHCTRQVTGTDFAEEPGAGAAGGLGFALMSYLGATISPGVELMMQVVGLDADMQGADYVITGEGKIDHKTAIGKPPISVARVAKENGAKVIAIAGDVASGAQGCNRHGIDAFFSILPGAMTLEESVQKEMAMRNAADLSEQIFRLILAQRGEAAKTRDDMGAMVQW